MRTQETVQAGHAMEQSDYAAFAHWTVKRQGQSVRMTKMRIAWCPLSSASLEPTPLPDLSQRKAPDGAPSPL